VQRLGMFRFLGRIIARLANSPEWQSLAQSGETLDATIRTLYGRSRAVLACCGWTITSLVLNSGEIWIVLWAPAPQRHNCERDYFAKHGIDASKRRLSFPGALGVQESGYVLVGNLLGIPGDTAFAPPLIARVRELSLGMPGLVAWQLIEGRRLWRARTRAVTAR